MGAGVNAAKLLGIARVRARLAELQARGARRAEITLEGLIEEAAELQRKAAEDGAYSAAVSALTLKAKLSGFHIDRSENVNVNYAISDKPSAVAASREGRRSPRSGSHQPLQEIASLHRGLMMSIVHECAWPIAYHQFPPSGRP